MSTSPLNPFDPYWSIRANAAVDNQREDAAYAQKVIAFQAACAEWERNAQLKGGLNLPPAPQPPTKLVFDVDVNGVKSDKPWSDPALHAPVYTVPANTDPGGPLVPVIVPPDRTDQLLAGQKVLYDLLTRVLTKLGG